MKLKRKPFTILKWLVFPSLTLALASTIAWFNLSIFGRNDGAVYIGVVAVITGFSIAINNYIKFNEDDDTYDRLAIGAFCFEIALTLILAVNAAYSLSVQRKMSIAKQDEGKQSQDLATVSKLKDRRAQREAAQMLREQSHGAQSSRMIFSENERPLFYIMLGEMLAYIIAAFSLYAFAQLTRGSKQKSSETETTTSGMNRSASGPMEAQYIAVDQAEYFPPEIDAGYSQDNRTGRRLSQTIKSDSARQSLSGDPEAFDRKTARKKLLEHLKVISHYHPGQWFKADLIEGGVHIRMCARINGLEETIAETRQSNNLLKAVDRPDFRERLLDELVRKNFPITKGKVEL